MSDQRTTGDQFGHLVTKLEDAMGDKELPSVLAIGQIPPDANPECLMQQPTRSRCDVSGCPVHDVPRSASASPYDEYADDNYNAKHYLSGSNSFQRLRNLLDAVRESGRRSASDSHPYDCHDHNCDACAATAWRLSGLGRATSNDQHALDDPPTALPKEATIDQLAALHAATTPGWRMCGPCWNNPRGCNLLWTDTNHEVPLAGGDEVCATNADAKFMAAIHQAFPTLLAKLRTGSAKHGEATSIVSWLRSLTNAPAYPHDLANEIEKTSGPCASPASELPAASAAGMSPRGGAGSEGLQHAGKGAPSDDGPDQSDSPLSRAAHSSGVEPDDADVKRAWAVASQWWTDEFAGEVATQFAQLIADVRRETIEEIATWLDTLPWRGTDAPHAGTIATCIRAGRFTSATTASDTKGVDR